MYTRDMEILNTGHHSFDTRFMYGIITFILYKLNKYNKNNILKEIMAMFFKGLRKRKLRECEGQKNTKYNYRNIS